MTVSPPEPLDVISPIPERPRTGSVPVEEQAAFLRPYVPRITVDWLRTTPTARHREVAGTMVFVDISGFTALSERLARKGKVGAELMRDTLDGVFTALLDEAYDWGASLLKWGGDALLLLFDGPDHERRACRAAWEMQGQIARVGRLHVSGGTIILRMSVGIATGSFHFFMTGSVHRELLVGGPDVTETLTMEGIADAEEIGISPRLAAMLDPACVGPRKGEAILLIAPPEVERGRAPDVGEIAGLDIASCIPVAAREHVLLRKTEPEHRTITAAFIDLEDTDALLDELGPLALAEALDERMRTIQEAALRYEVPFYESDVGKGSIKALLTAGAPSSTGHDEERMLRALREIMETPGLVPMRVGVNTGKVFTGDFGPPYRRAYRVFGDAINTAARVMSKAEPGQILSTEIVLARSRTLFETTPITPFAAKGKSEPVRASIVGPATGTRESHHGGIDLLGREPELQTLLELVDTVRTGQGAIVEVAAESGMGKTRLVEELIARSPDFRPIRTRAEEYEASTPYYPMRAIMRDVLEIEESADSDVVEERLRAAVHDLDPTLDPLVPLLGILLGLDLEDTPETEALEERFLRERLTEVAIRFFAGTLVNQPIIVIIEDAHFADDATRDLLLRMSQAAHDKRHVLVAMRQGGPVFPAGTVKGRPPVTVELLPLSTEGLIDIINTVTEDAPLQPHDAQEIARRSGGNALFLFELLDAVRETGSLESLPDSIELMIAGQIDQLAATDRTILRYASVLGASFDPALLSAAVREDVDIDAEAWSRLGDLVHEESTGNMRFRNTLIRDAAYEGLPYRRRRDLHARVGETIEERAGISLDEEVGALALHYFEAQRWDKAWTFCRMAGDRAMSIYANVEAAHSYERALIAGRWSRNATKADLADVHELVGDIRYDLGEPERADRQFLAARRLIGDDLAAASRLATKQAKQTTTQGRYRTALTRATRAIAALDGVRGRQAAADRAQLYVLVGWIRASQDRPAEAIEWCQRGAAEARRARDDEALARAYQVMDSAYFDLGQLDKVVYSRKALAIFERLGDLRRQALTLNNMGVYTKELSRWSEARAMYDRARELFEQIGDRSLESLTKYNIAEILSDQGHYEDAERLIRDVIRAWRAAGAETDVAEAWRELARIMARRGELDDARDLLERARAVQVEHGQSGEVLTTDCRLAEVLVLGADSAPAIDLTADISTRAQGTGGGAVLAPSLHRLHGWARLQLGEYELARAEFERSLEASRDREDAYQTALALEGLVAIGRVTERDTAAESTEMREILRRLGIETTPAVPVAAADVVPA